MTARVYFRQCLKTQPGTNCLRDGSPISPPGGPLLSGHHAELLHGPPQSRSARWSPVVLQCRQLCCDAWTASTWFLRIPLPALHVEAFFPEHRWIIPYSWDSWPKSSRGRYAKKLCLTLKSMLSNILKSALGSGSCFQPSSRWRTSSMDSFAHSQAGCLVEEVCSRSSRPSMRLAAT